MNEYDYSYTAGKFADAVYELVGPDSLKGRLFKAYLQIIGTHPLDLPEHLRGAHSELQESLTWLPPEQVDQGTLLSALEAMSMEQASSRARQIFELYMRIAEASYVGE